MDDLIDPTGTPLTPSFHGKDCLGNGEHPGIECCCNECDHYLTCFPEFDPEIDALIAEYEAAAAAGTVLELPDSLDQRIAEMVKSFFPGRQS